MATAVDNLSLSVGLSVAKVRSVIQSLVEHIEDIQVLLTRSDQAKQRASDEKIKELTKEINFHRHNDKNIEELTVNKGFVSKASESTALSLENAKLQKDLEEALYIVDSKTSSLESLNKKLIRVESDLDLKNNELGQKNTQLKNIDMMVSVFEKNMASVRSQFAEVQERFLKEQASVAKLRHTHESITESQHMHKDEMNKLLLENKMKQNKIKSQEDKLNELFGKLREQTSLLEETKVKLEKLNSKPARRSSLKRSKEKEFLGQSLEASQRLLTDTTQLLRQREEAYGNLCDEKVHLEQEIRQLKVKLEEKIDPIDCRELKETVERGNETIAQLEEKNKKLSEHVKTYQSRELVLKEEVILQDKKITKATEDLQSVTKSLQSYKDLSGMLEKKLEAAQGELEANKLVMFNLQEELLRADKKTARSPSATALPTAPPLVITAAESPLSNSTRKLFTPPLPRPMASSPIQRPIRPALIYTDDDVAAEPEARSVTRDYGGTGREDRNTPCYSDTNNHGHSSALNDRIDTLDDEVQDLFVLDFDIPAPQEADDNMEVDAVFDDGYDYDDAFQRASTMYPSTAKTNRSNLATASKAQPAPKRKSNLDDFIQVAPRSAAPSKPAPGPREISGFTYATGSNNHTSNTAATNTMRAPIGPSFSTYKYKTNKKTQSSTNSSGAFGCCSDNRHGPSVSDAPNVSSVNILKVQCTSCHKMYHHSCLRMNDRALIKDPFTCSTCAKRKPRAKK